MLRVDGFGGIEDGETIVSVHIIRGATQWSAVRLSLTHTRPDSWERLEEDATMSPWSYCDKYGLVVDRSDGELAPTNETFALDSSAAPRRCPKAVGCDEVRQDSAGEALLAYARAQVPVVRPRGGR